MAIDKLTTFSLSDNSVTTDKIAPGAVQLADIPDGEITMAKLSQVDLTIAPEVLEIQVDAPAAGQDTAWLWTWEQSTLPYARRTITNSNELQVPLYKQGTYVVNNFAAYTAHAQMTQTHSLYLKWIEGAGTDNLVSWATSAGPISDSHPDINGGAATDVQRITVNVPATITPPTLTAPSVSYNVTNNGAGAYTFSGSAAGDNPNLGPFYRGGTYTINISATGHPFYFTTDNGTNFSAGTYFGEYTSGVTGSRTDSGTITFTVPSDAPDTLYYQCGNHSVMRGAITVKNLAVETNINGNYVVYFQHTQEGHKTPVELRPIPSLVNQMCLVFDATSGKFVPQDLATYVENTPSFENKIREVAGTAELVVEDGSAVVAKVNVYDDSTYLPLTGNNPGDQAFATDTNILYIWDGSAWQQAGTTNTDDLTEGTTNLFYTDARVNTYLSSNGYDTATNIIASITDSAPATLDTLNELAAALGDDPNFATTTANSIALKAPIDNPSFTGNVGIGTTNPTYKLDVSGGGRFTSSVRFENYIQFAGTISTPAVAAAIYRPVDNNLAFSTANTERMRIDSSGSVGIGIDNPSAKLEITSNNDAQRSLTVNPPNSGDVDVVNINRGYGSHKGSGLRIFGANYTNGTNANAGMIELNAGAYSGANTNYIHAYDDTGTDFIVKGDGTVNIGTKTHNHSATLSVEKNDHGTYFYGGGSSQQNRGLSFTSELGSLGSAYVGAKHTIEVESGGGELYFKNNNYNWLSLAPSGNVGIGNATTPTASLHIRDTSSDADVIIETASQSLRIDQNSIRTTTSSPLAMFTNNNAQQGFRIENDGRMIIGNTAGQSDVKLTVNGNVKMGSAAASSWANTVHDIGGLDVIVGSGSHLIQAWDDNYQTRPRFEVQRDGRVWAGQNMQFHENNTSTTTPFNITNSSSTENFFKITTYGSGSVNQTYRHCYNIGADAHWVHFTGGGGNTVFTTTAYIAGEHYQDITVWSITQYYSDLKIKVVQNTGSDKSIWVAGNTYNNNVYSLQWRVTPIRPCAIEHNPSSSQSAGYMIHHATGGEQFSGTSAYAAGQGPSTY